MKHVRAEGGHDVNHIEEANEALQKQLDEKVTTLQNTIPKQLKSLERAQEEMLENISDAIAISVQQLAVSPIAKQIEAIKLLMREESGMLLQTPGIQVPLLNQYCENQIRLQKLNFYAAKLKAITPNQIQIIKQEILNQVKAKLKC